MLLRAKQPKDAANRHRTSRAHQQEACQASLIPPENENIGEPKLWPGVIGNLIADVLENLELVWKPFHDLAALADAEVTSSASSGGEQSKEDSGTGELNKASSTHVASPRRRRFR
jgi:hypothetical protein